jgi:hypothetical protein
LQAVLIAFISLVILFLWLNFVLTQEIESIGREIQVKREELRALERQNDALLREISVAGSERNLAQRAKALGYRPDVPVYLAVEEPIARSAEDAAQMGSLSSSLTAEERQTRQSDPLWSLLNRQFGHLEEERAP